MLIVPPPPRHWVCCVCRNYLPTTRNTLSEKDNIIQILQYLMINGKINKKDYLHLGSLCLPVDCRWN